MRSEKSQQTQDRPVIESASGTTSPDNQNSGAFAYVVFGVVVGLLLLVVGGLSSCTSSLLRLAALGIGTVDEQGAEPTEDLPQDWGLTQDDTRYHS